MDFDRQLFEQRESFLKKLHITLQTFFYIPHLTVNWQWKNMVNWEKIEKIEWHRMCVKFNMKISIAIVKESRLMNSNQNHDFNGAILFLQTMSLIINEFQIKNIPNFSLFLTQWVNVLYSFQVATWSIGTILYGLSFWKERNL